MFFNPPSTNNGCTSARTKPTRMVTGPDKDTIHTFTIPCALDLHQGLHVDASGTVWEHP